MDETTPHIHATLVPIVTGERRKAKEPKAEGKKRYRKKSSSLARLCADDIMNRIRLKEYQDGYAVAMRKYGLRRGIEGSEARHIPASEFYRDVFLRQGEIKEQVEAAVQQRDTVNEQVSMLYDHRDEAREKFYRMEGFAREAEQARLRIEAEGPVKVYMEQQKEVEELRQENSSFKDELDEIHGFFPHLKQWLVWARFLKKIGFAVELVRRLFTFQPLGFRGSLYSHEFKRHYETQGSVAQLSHPQGKPEELSLTIDNRDHTQWFRDKDKELHRVIGMDVQEKKVSRGRKI